MNGAQSSAELLRQVEELYELFQPYMDSSSGARDFLDYDQDGGQAKAAPSAMSKRVSATFFCLVAFLKT